jgi:hypothetical protein
MRLLGQWTEVVLKKESRGLVKKISYLGSTGKKIKKTVK